jgi:hypothetical protein
MSRRRDAKPNSAVTLTAALRSRRSVWLSPATLAELLRDQTIFEV